jgi:hypothetical protein
LLKAVAALRVDGAEPRRHFAVLDSGCRPNISRGDLKHRERVTAAMDAFGRYVVQ